MKTRTYSLVATLVVTLLFSIQISAQTGLYLGDPTQPLPTDTIAPLSFHGEYLDMSGGYNVGDTVADFQIYNIEGESLKLSDLYQGDKYIVLSSGSATCIRFFSCFDQEAEATEYQESFEFMWATRDVIEWIFIYGPEAHPGDLENCTSNCPAITIPAPNGDTLYQHKIYQDRIDAAQLWLDICEEDTLSYAWDWPLYLDNPSNSVYDNFFARPYGCVVLDCRGVVLARGDWTSQFLGTFGGIEELEGFMEDGFQQCGYPPVCYEEDLDTDGDGYCDEYELFIGSNWNNMCDPDNTDSDGDGYCDNHENYAGSDPFDPCSPIISDACELCPDGANDSDGDGVCDAMELNEGTNPDDPCDPNGFDADNDGICDVVEILNGSDELDPCSPNNDDSDGDGICDVVELIEGTDPNNACDPNGEDFDQDGICDTVEIIEGTDPDNPCDPLDTDEDEDGYCDMQESILGSDPEDPCDPDDTDTDNDGTCDILEIINGTDPLVDENATFVSKASATQFNVYPNPAHEQLFIDSNINISSLELYDLTGKVVATFEYNASAGIDITSLETGLYLLSATSANGNVYMSRVTKK